jgi:hypothetical protein
MALKSETKEIDGLVVISTQFPAMKGYTLFTRLCRLAAPVIGSLASGLNGKTDIREMSGALTELFGQLDENQASELALKLLSSTQVKLMGEDGKPARIVTLTDQNTINGVFEGNLMAMFGAMRLAIEVNFADFIASALSAARARKALAEAKAEALMQAAKAAVPQA